MWTTKPAAFYLTNIELLDNKFCSYSAHLESGRCAAWTMMSSWTSKKSTVKSTGKIQKVFVHAVLGGKWLLLFSI